MKQLNQIILCSRNEGRSYLRELSVMEDYAFVTHVEALPFRYHELLLSSKRKRKDKIDEISVPIRNSALHDGCAYCGNGTTFQCDHCGFYSCMKTGAEKHYCPGCDKNYKAYPAETSRASLSGFMHEPKKSPAEGIEDSWARAQDALLGLIQHRNRTTE
ncbi:MAG: hypothetical protein RIC85_04060 [Gammaproteobacteria bacterium]